MQWVQENNPLNVGPDPGAGVDTRVARWVVSSNASPPLLFATSLPPDEGTFD